MICKNVKAAISSSLAALLLVGLVGCSGTLNFESDGDCDYNDTLGITYKIEDGKLRFYLGAISEAYDFSKNGNKITLSKDGESVTYTKD